MQVREYLHPTLPFGRFNAELYGNAVEGYQQQSVSMAQLGKWEMDVIRGVVRAMSKSEGGVEGRVLE